MANSGQQLDPSHSNNENAAEVIKYLQDAVKKNSQGKMEVSEILILLKKIENQSILTVGQVKKILVDAIILNNSEGNQRLISALLVNHHINRYYIDPLSLFGLAESNKSFNVIKHILKIGIDDPDNSIRTQANKALSQVSHLMSKLSHPKEKEALQLLLNDLIKMLSDPERYADSFAYDLLEQHSRKFEGWEGVIGSMALLTTMLSSTYHKAKELLPDADEKLDQSDKAFAEKTIRDLRVIQAIKGLEIAVRENYSAGRLHELIQKNSILTREQIQKVLIDEVVANNSEDNKAAIYYLLQIFKIDYKELSAFAAHNGSLNVVKCILKENFNDITAEGSEFLTRLLDTAERAANYTGKFLRAGWKLANNAAVSLSASIPTVSAASSLPTPPPSSLEATPITPIPEQVDHKALLKQAVQNNDVLARNKILEEIAKTTLLKSVVEANLSLETLTECFTFLSALNPNNPVCKQAGNVFSQANALINKLPDEEKRELQSFVDDAKKMLADPEKNAAAFAKRLLEKGPDKLLDRGWRGVIGAMAMLAGTIIKGFGFAAAPATTRLGTTWDETIKTKGRELSVFGKKSWDQHREYKKLATGLNQLVEMCRPSLPYKPK